MTISSKTTQESYIGDGTTKTFPFNNVVQKEVDLSVYLDDELQTTGYTITNLNYSSSNVVFNNPPDSDVFILIKYNISIDQTLELRNQQRYNPDELEDALDRETLISLQINSELNNIQSEATQYLNASKKNIDVGRDVSNYNIDSQYNDVLYSLGDDGNIIETTVKGYSSLHYQHYSYLWSNSDSLINDKQGNTGYSAKKWSSEANKYANSDDKFTPIDGGDQVYSAKYYSIKSETSASTTASRLDTLQHTTTQSTTELDLVDKKNNKAWENVFDNSIEVYLDDQFLTNPVTYDSDGNLIPCLYSLSIQTSPTLSNPTKIIFNPAIDTGKKITVRRGATSPDGAAMLKNGSNFINDDTSLVAARDLSNIAVSNLITFPTNTKINGDFSVSGKSDINGDLNINGNLKISSQALHAITDMLFYVGISIPSDVNPSTKGWAGTWEQLPSGYALMSDDKYQLYNQDGNPINSTVSGDIVHPHQITIDEMPSHNHSIKLKYGQAGSINGNLPYSSSDTGVITQNTGGNKPHNHEFKTKVSGIVIWKRTA